MRLSCLPVSFFDEILSGRMTVLDWAALGARLGLDAIDLSILFVQELKPAQAAELRRSVADLGMSITMLTSYPDFTHPDPLQRQKELEKELGVVELASHLGAQYVRVTAGQAHPQTSIQDGIAWASQGLNRLVDQARAFPIQLVYENHAKPLVWDFTDFSQPPGVFLQIVHNTADACLGINFDTGNAAAFADDPLWLLERVIGRVKTIHAADTATKGALKHTLLGTGVTPFRQIFARLKQAGWDGWICMEEGSRQGKTGVRKAVDFIRRTWSET